MKYKLNSNNQRFIMKSNSSNFALQDAKDIVELTFNEEDQVFIANIKSPSQHTMYLLNEGLLGVALCKLNTGVSQRQHYKSLSRGDEEWTYVKEHFHPRWSRCGLTVVPVTSLNPIELAIDNSSCYYTSELRPNQRHSLYNKEANWFTYIKATLIRLSKTEQGITSPMSRGEHCRAYKTESNRIGIEYSRASGIITRRPPRGCGFFITPLGSRTLRISFQSLSSYWADCQIDIIMAMNDISNQHSHGEYKHIYDTPDDPRQYGVNHFVKRHSNTEAILQSAYIDSQTEYIDVTLPDIGGIDIDSPLIHQRVRHACEKARQNNFIKGPFYYRSPIWIQIRRTGCDSKMRCLNYEEFTISYRTDLKINIITTS